MSTSNFPTKCYTTYGLTTNGSDYTTYRFYLGFGLLHTTASEIHIISKEGGSEHKVMVQSEHCFLSSDRYHMSCAIICFPGFLFCRSKASLHCYSEIPFCGSAKWSHSCTQISWPKPRLGWLSPPLYRLLVLPPAPFLWLWGYMVNIIGEERTIQEEKWPHKHILSPSSPLVAT